MSQGIEEELQESDANRADAFPYGSSFFIFFFGKIITLQTEV